MNEVVIRAIILLMVFLLAGFLISRATRGLIRLVVVAVLTLLFLIAGSSMYRQIMESRMANSLPQTSSPQVTTSSASPAPTSPAATASPTATSAPIVASPDEPASPAETPSEAVSYTRIGFREVPNKLAPYVASVGGQATPQTSFSQPASQTGSSGADYQPDYQAPAAQRPSPRQPIPAGW